MKNFVRNMKNLDWKKVLPYVVAVVAFFVVALVYCAPLLEGKVLQAGDVNNWKGAAHEVQVFAQETGETSWWTNSMFGGMPTYQITGKLQSSSVVSVLTKPAHGFMRGDYEAIGLLFAYFFGFFLLLRCFGVNPWISIAGGFAIGLSTYFLLIIPAGHMTKATAIGFLAPVIGGFYAIFRRNYWLGVPLVLLYGIMGVVCHPQMTYYYCMLLGVMGCAELYIHIREKRWKDLGISLAVLIGCVLLIYATKLSWWQMNNSYLKETMRGGHSELTQSANVQQAENTGLDIDYATAWSYGKAETLTLLIPNYMGGCSGYDLGKDSQLEQDLKKMGVPARQAKGFCQGAPTYWGEKAFTSGPVYVGAIICMLFVLGLLIVPGPYKWALLIATLFSITLAWGRNLMGWTELFFNYFPMYSKFRAVESILVVAEVTIPLLGFLALKELMTSDNEKQKRNRTMVWIAGGVTAAICLIVALFGGAFDVTSSYDAQWKNQVGPQIYDAILNQRHAMMTSSAWRSLLFVVLGTATLLLYTWKRDIKNSTIVLAVVLGGLVLADMIPVNRHFFNNNNFVTKKDGDRYFAMQPWEEQILQDKSLDYRVFNLAANTFNDARTSYRLKSIGGYSAAKLRRYQDLIDAHISQNNWAVIDMLNTKYIITRDGQVHQNPNAMGNAWFVDSVLLVDTPDEESEALRTLNLRTTAVADKTFADMLDVTKPECSSLMAFDEDRISLTSYKPNELIYDSQNERNKVAVFSEIYYPHDWHLYIDGEEAPIARVNYTLRAAVIPAGIHTVRMVFEPQVLGLDAWCIASIVLAIVLSVALFCYPLFRRK